MLLEVLEVELALLEVVLVEVVLVDAVEAALEPESELAGKLAEEPERESVL